VSASVTNPRLPLLPLPGFQPDAVPFAIRTTLALLLGYLISFAIQLDSASSTGVCVAIVAQPSPGMAISKAIWRAAGTVLGGVVALAMAAAFPQDRTMLLLAFTLWLGACTFVAALLRDFRSYGAVLCGYTVGIIAITGIDAPDGVLMATLNRVAAILIGILSVAIVNTALSRPAAFERLVAALRQHLTRIEAIALDTLEGRPAPGSATSIRAGIAILLLRTEAVYAAAELAQGRARRRGAVAAIAGLLGMLSAARALGAEPALPDHGEWLAQAAAALRAGHRKPPPGPPPRSPAEAFTMERTAELLAHHAMAIEGLQVLAEGGRVTQPVRLRVHHDVVGAWLSALRTMIAVGLGAVFCVVAGWPGSTGLLVQQAAFTALLGMQPNPTASAAAMGWALAPGVIAAGLVGYVLLPQVSGFVPFALAVAPFAFALILLGQSHRFARLAAGLPLYFTLLLAPSNTETFDLAAFANNVLVQMMAIVFMMLAFLLILPVSRKRRLFRIADAITTDLATTLRLGRPLDEASTHLLEYDRMAQAETWMGPPSPARVAVLEQLTAMIDLDLELRRAWSGLHGLPDRPAMARAKQALVSQQASVMAQAASDLLEDPPAGPAPVMVAVSGLHRAAQLLDRESHALPRYHVVDA
jgi:uncharacterized membrane protein YccC